MENQIIPNVAQIWLYEYTGHEKLYLFITNILPPSIRRDYEIICFCYLDTWEPDEMPLDTFHKYSKLVSG